MNSIRNWLNNPNVHLYGALVLGICSAVPVLAPFASILQAVGLTLTTTGAILPETGSLHQIDYAKLATALGDGAAKAIAAVPGRQ